MSICTLTARRVKPGQMDALKQAFEAANEGAPEEILKRWPQVFVCRDVTDENVLLTFGFFEGSVEELREIQSESGEERSSKIDEHVDEVLFDGSFEVVRKIEY